MAVFGCFLVISLMGKELAYMESFLDSLGPLGYFYLACAVLGGILFVTRFFLQFVGGDHSDISDLADHHDSDVDFKVLSLQGLSAFFLMFGLVGLALHASAVYVSVPAAILAGLGSVWIIRLLFRFMIGLQSSGTLKLENAVGQQGRVYLAITPAQGGKVQISVQNRLLTLDAVAESSTVQLETGSPVVVVALQNNNTVVVRPL